MRLLPAFLLLPALLAACESAPTTQTGETSFVKRPLDTTTPVEGRYMRLAKKAEAEGRPELATVLYRAAVLADEKDKAPRVASAELFEKVGEYGAAATLYEDLAKAEAQESSAADLSLLAARNWLKAERYAEARGLYESVIIKNPQDWRAYNGLAVTHDMEGNSLAAQQNYPLAFDKAPIESRAAVAANWGLSLMLAEKPGDAVEKLASMPDAETNPVLKRRLALAYALAGRPEDAQRLGLTKVPTAADLRRELQAAKQPEPKKAAKTLTEKAFDKAATPAGAVPPPPSPAALPKAAPTKALDVEGLKAKDLVAPPAAPPVTP